MDERLLKQYLATGERTAAMDETDRMTDLARHDAKYHPNGYKEGDRCKYRAALARNDKYDELFPGVHAQRAEHAERLEDAELKAERKFRFADVFPEEVFHDLNKYKQAILSVVPAVYGDDMLANTTVTLNVEHIPARWMDPPEDVEFDFQASEFVNWDGVVNEIIDNALLDRYQDDDIVTGDDIAMMAIDWVVDNRHEDWERRLEKDRRESWDFDD